MAAFVALRAQQGTVYINPDSVSCIVPMSGGTSLVYIGDHTFHVNDSASRLRDLLQNPTMLESD
jgi:hypothetical protein